MADALDDIAAAIAQLQRAFMRHGLEPPKSIRLPTFEAGMKARQVLLSSPSVWQSGRDLTTATRSLRINGCVVYWPTQPDGCSFRDEPHGAG